MKMMLIIYHFIGTVCSVDDIFFFLSLKFLIYRFVVLGQAYCGLTGGFLLLRIFSVGISVSPLVCFILDLILISMFLR